MSHLGNISRGIYDSFLHPYSGCCYGLHLKRVLFMSFIILHVISKSQSRRKAGKNLASQVAAAVSTCHVKSKCFGSPIVILLSWRRVNFAGAEEINFVVMFMSTRYKKRPEPLIRNRPIFHKDDSLAKLCEFLNCETK